MQTMDWERLKTSVAADRVSAQNAGVARRNDEDYVLSKLNAFLPCELNRQQQERMRQTPHRGTLTPITITKSGDLVVQCACDRFEVWSFSKFDQNYITRHKILLKTIIEKLVIAYVELQTFLKLNQFCQEPQGELPETRVQFLRELLEEAQKEGAFDEFQEEQEEATFLESFLSHQNSFVKHFSDFIQDVREGLQQLDDLWLCLESFPKFEESSQESFQNKLYEKLHKKRFPQKGPAVDLELFLKQLINNMKKVNKYNLQVSEIANDMVKYLSETDEDYFRCKFCKSYRPWSKAWLDQNKQFQTTL